MLSIIIPSRQPEFLQNTIDDLLARAEGEVEIIVVLDGYWFQPEPNDRVKIIHQGTQHNNLGMRAAINVGVAVAEGEYIMKTDEHTMFSQGYDKRLSETCQDDWLVVPRRYRLDAENWKIIEDGRKPIDYMYIEYPYLKPFDKTQGLHGAEDRQRYYERKNIEIDDLMTTQGSCWFLKKSYFDKLFPSGLDEEKYGTFTMEAQELTNTVWLSGGRVVVDKGCHYAHLHKGSRGTGYGFSKEQWKRHAESMEKGRLYAMEFWLSTKDYKYDFEWLVNKFWPLPKWKETWKKDIITDRNKDYSTLGYKDSEWLSGLRNEKIN